MRTKVSIWSELRAALLPVFHSSWSYQVPKNTHFKKLNKIKKRMNDSSKSGVHCIMPKIYFYFCDHVGSVSEPELKFGKGRRTDRIEVRVGAGQNTQGTDSQVYILIVNFICNGFMFIFFLILSFIGALF